MVLKRPPSPTSRSPIGIHLIKPTSSDRLYFISNLQVQLTIDKYIYKLTIGYSIIHTHTPEGISISLISYTASQSSL